MRKNTYRFIAGALLPILLLSAVLQTGDLQVQAQNEKVYGVATASDALSASEREAEKEYASSFSAKEQENKKCRVIVELEGDSLLDTAVEKQLSYADLPDSLVEDRKEELKSRQDEVLHVLKEKGLEADFTETRHYDTVLNGIAFSLQEQDIRKVEDTEGVKRVYVAQEYERPLLRSSKDIVGALYAWDTLGYKGEGTVVAVIDSGIHTEHRALRLDDESLAKLQRPEVEALIQEGHLRGRYYNAKIPYGYNYYDNSHGLRDAYGVMHGMHVSGIVGANDKEKGIQGVAPNTQILAMKVFSDDLRYPTTFTDVWLQAVDDALTLKADVINMSLGAAAGLSVEDRAYPEVELIRKARQAGVNVVVAAGNDADISHGNSYDVLPLQENYDTAVIASPALHEDTLAVASMENGKQNVHIIRWQGTDGTYVQEAVHLYGQTDKEQVIKGKFTDLGKGEESKILQKDIENRIAMLEFPARGDMRQYTEKVQKILECKPLALILYNDRELGDQLGSNIDLQGEAASYTVLRAKHGSYQKITERAALNPDKNLELEIPGTIQEIDNPRAGRISVFSSWGPAPDLRMKPEISAPGGNIYSTAENNRYKNMSGTSMAAPQVSAAAALIQQHIKAKNIQTDNEADFTKLLLMNTAEPLINPDSEGGSTPYFVRQQGSGVMMLDKALQTGVVVRAKGTNDDKADGKLELKELSAKSFDVVLEFENFSDKDKQYYISTTAMYEPTENGRRSKRSAPLGGEQDAFYERVEVAAGTKKSYSFHVSYEDAAALQENQFLEGYINIEDAESIADLHVPFLGFYGDWDAQRAIDAFVIPELNTGGRQVQFYVNKELNVASSAFVTKRMLPLPLIDGKVYFAPEGLYHTELASRLAPLRNMDSIEYAVLDGESGETLRVLGISHSVRKLNRLSRNNTFRLMPDSVWDGRIDGKLAQEGKTYIYQIKAKLNTEKGGEQIYRYPVGIDGTAPYFVGQAYLSERDGGRLKDVHWRAADTGSGIQDVYIQSVKYDKGTGDSYTGSPKYGKYTKIRFVEEESLNGKVLPKVVEGKVEIPLTEVPTDESSSGEVFVCINGHRNREVEISCPYFADTSHIQIALKDYLSNRKAVEFPSGVQENYHSLQFLNFYNAIRDNQVEITVNGERLEQYAYSTTASKVEIQMHIPNISKHLSTLYVKKSRYRTDYILDGDKPNFDNMEKYGFRYDKDSRNIYFKLEPFEGSCEIITGFKDGEMPEWGKSESVRVDLSAAGLERFKEYRQDKEILSFAPGEQSFSMPAGRMKLQLTYKEGGYKEIDKLILRQNGSDKVLRSGAYFDLEEGRISGYSNSPYALRIYADLQTDVALIIRYKEAGDSLFPKAAPLASPSEASPSDAQEAPGEIELPEAGNTDHDDDKDKEVELLPGETDDSNYLYPLIFLTRPGLLEVLSRQNVQDDRIEVKGFVGKVKHRDSIEKLSIQVLDAKGNPRGEALELKPEELERKATRYKEKGKTWYAGYAYHFDREIKIEDYAVSIQVSVLTKAGERASIVRRVLYDKEEPQLNYEVLDRDLDSDTASLRIRARDNSFKVKVYRGDSLLGSVDHSARSLFTEGAEWEKEIQIPLQAGQNEIRISAVDLANQKIERSIYIYRTR